MNLIEAFKLKTEAVEVFASLADARRKLIGSPLTNELFNELNGEDGGLEALVGHSILINDDVAEMTALRNEIFDAIESEEINCGNSIRAALECLSEDLVQAVQTYDARFSNDAETRLKLKDALAALSKDAANTFLTSKCDFTCYAHTDILEFVELFKDTAKFLNSDVVNKNRIQDLMSKQGVDMTDDDREFLHQIREIFNTTLSTEDNESKLFRMRTDRLTGATVQALGFDIKTLVDTVDTFAKSEEKLIASVRVLREILAERPLTTDGVAIKNRDFDEAFWGMCWWIHTLCRVRADINDQFSLMLGMVETASASSTPTKKETDEGHEEHEEGNLDSHSSDSTQGGENNG